MAPSIERTLYPKISRTELLSKQKIPKYSRDRFKNKPVEPSKAARIIRVYAYQQADTGPQEEVDDE